MAVAYMEVVLAEEDIVPFDSNPQKDSQKGGCPPDKTLNLRDTVVVDIAECTYVEDTVVKYCPSNEVA